jgi:hypothetical protein
MELRYFLVCELNPPAIKTRRLLVNGCLIRAEAAASRANPIQIRIILYENFSTSQRKYQVN